jgi:hypothetical protein
VSFVNLTLLASDMGKNVTFFNGDGRICNFQFYHGITKNFPLVRDDSALGVIAESLIFSVTK